MFDMFSTIIKNFFGGPATRMYPHVKRDFFPEVRGQLSGIDADLCIYCGICQRKCPAIAITVDKATKTWTLDPYKCVICNVCVENCPKKCMKMDAQYRPPVSHKSHLSQSPTPQPEAPDSDQPLESCCEKPG